MRLGRRTLILVVSFFLSVSFPANAAEEFGKVVLGHTNIRNDVAQLWVPKELGLFHKYGLDAALVFFSGARAMIQVIASGTAPMGVLSGPPVTNAVVGGLDAVILLGITNRITYDIWAAPEIKSPADLKGKKLGISAFGSGSHLASFLMLQHFGLEEKRDRVTFLAIGNEAMRAQALIGGAIDATIIDPSLAGPVKEKGFSYLGNLDQLGVPFINNALVSTRRYVKENPRFVEAVIKGIVEGNAFILNRANRARVTAILAKNLRLDTSEAEKTYEDLLPKVERKPYPSMEAVKAMIQQMGVINPKIAKLRPEDLVDVSALHHLEQSGFIQ